MKRKLFLIATIDKWRSAKHIWLYKVHIHKITKCVQYHRPFLTIRTWVRYPFTTVSLSVKSVRFAKSLKSVTRRFYLYRRVICRRRISLSPPRRVQANYLVSAMKVKVKGGLQKLYSSTCLLQLLDIYNFAHLSFSPRKICLRLLFHTIGHS